MLSYINTEMIVHYSMAVTTYTQKKSSVCHKSKKKNNRKENIKTFW